MPTFLDKDGLPPGPGGHLDGPCLIIQKLPEKTSKLQSRYRKLPATNCTVFVQACWALSKYAVLELKGLKKKSHLACLKMAKSQVPEISKAMRPMQFEY